MNPKHYKILGYLQIFVGMGALSGGLPLMSNPDGSSQGLTLDLLANTPFDDFLIPGILLFSVIGVGNLSASFFSLKFKEQAGLLGVMFGVALIIWILAQMYFIGFSNWFQPIFLDLGTLQLVLGIFIRKKLKEV